MKRVSLSFKQVLYQPNETIQHVYFLENGAASILTLMEDGAAVEVGTVGNEGMVGIPVFLGGDFTPNQTFMQIPGDAMRMRADVFKHEITLSTPLHNLLQRYTQACLNQGAQSVACNCLHSTEQRFCRWLLMTHDRVGSDSFPLTHEFLAMMLGVRRATVSVVAAIIQKASLIYYKGASVLTNFSLV